MPSKKVIRCAACDKCYIKRIDEPTLFCKKCGNPYEVYVGEQAQKVLAKSMAKSFADKSYYSESADLSGLSYGGQKLFKENI